MIKRTFYRAFNLILWDWPTLLLFELLYKLLGSLLAFPILRMILISSMDSAGVSFLSNHNLSLLLQNPVTVLLLICLIFLLAFYSYIELTAVVLYFDHGMNGERMGAWKLLRKAVRTALSILNPRNFMLLAFILLIIPLTGIDITAGALQRVQVPEFVLEFILDSPLLTVVYLALLAVLVIVVFRWIFSFHVLTLHGGSFKQARGVSRLMMKGRLIRFFLIYSLWMMIVALAAFVIYYFAIGFLLLLIRALNGPIGGRTLFWSSFGVLTDVSAVFLAVFGFAGSFALISAFYYESVEDPQPMKPKPPLNRRQRALWIPRVLLIFYLAGLFTDMSSYREYLAFDTELFHGTAVVGHRAASYYAPENTIPALREAVNSGAEYAEIDVQQLKDGGLVLLHDTNFERTTGVNKNVWDATSEEVKEYDAGKWFGGEFANTKVSFLEDVLVYARGKINLMVELKSTGHEKGLEESVLALLKKYHVENQTIVASMNLDILQRVKELNPEIQTAYIAAVAYGDYYDIPWADMFSVEASFVTPSAVAVLHEMGKKIFVWTVNSQSEMERFSEMHVDGIVTDDPDLARYVLDTKGNHQMLDSIVSRVFPE